MKNEDQLSVNDQLAFKKETLSEDELAKVQRASYEIISPNGLFKNGRQFKQGDQIQLDDRTAKSFLESNDIKKI